MQMLEGIEEILIRNLEIASDDDDLLPEVVVVPDSRFRLLSRGRKETAGIDEDIFRFL